MIKQVRQALNVLSIFFNAAEDVAESTAAGTRVLRKYATDWEEQEQYKLDMARKQRSSAMAQLQLVEDAPKEDASTDEAKAS